MGAITKIEWTNHSASPWYGCTHRILPDGTEHPGCEHCYAELQATRNPGTLGIWGPEGTRILSKSFWQNCLDWNAAAEKTRNRDSVFPSICDPFENWQGPILDSKKQRIFKMPSDCNGAFLHTANTPDVVAELATKGIVPVTMDHLRTDLFWLIGRCPWVNFLLLTKRPEDAFRLWPHVGFPSSGLKGTLGRRLYFDNVWLGTSISNQHTANLLVPELRKCRGLCKYLFLSAEPLLDQIDLVECGATKEIDQIIVGGESGPHARPCWTAWIESIAAQCQAFSISCFVKQLGDKPWSEYYHDNDSFREYFLNRPHTVMQATGGRNFSEWCHRTFGQPSPRSMVEWKPKQKKGGDMSEWPDSIRIRQSPDEKVAA